MKAQQPNLEVCIGQVRIKLDTTMGDVLLFSLHVLIIFFFHCQRLRFCQNSLTLTIC